LIEATQSIVELVVLWVFVVAPFVALLAAIPLAWGWGVSTLDLAMAGVGYLIAIAGVTVGFHSHLTRGSFKARRPLRIALAVAGCLAVEGAPNDRSTLVRTLHDVGAAVWLGGSRGRRPGTTRPRW
jgi:stearoyl-CoA desaturase (Delta-9 desaturase)